VGFEKRPPGGNAKNGNGMLNKPTKLVINGPAPSRSCNVAAAEVPSSARILQMQC